MSQAQPCGRRRRLSGFEVGSKRDVNRERAVGGIERELSRVPPVAADLGGDRSAAAGARRALEPLRRALTEARFGDVRLLVSELVADEVRARESERDRAIRLFASLDADLLRVELADGWTEDAVPTERPAPGEMGWGLYLAGILADRWGIEPATQGSTVWFEVRI